MELFSGIGLYIDGRHLCTLWAQMVRRQIVHAHNIGYRTDKWIRQIFSYIHWTFANTRHHWNDGHSIFSLLLDLNSCSNSRISGDLRPHNGRVITVMSVWCCYVSLLKGSHLLPNGGGSVWYKITAYWKRVVFNTASSKATVFEREMHTYTSILCIWISASVCISGTMNIIMVIMMLGIMACTLQWPHNECDGVSNHHRLDCLFKRVFRRRSENTSKIRVTDLCEGSSPVTDESPHKGAVTRKMFRFDDIIMIQVKPSTFFRMPIALVCTSLIHTDQCYLSLEIKCMYCQHICKLVRRLLKKKTTYECRLVGDGLFVGR